MSSITIEPPLFMGRVNDLAVLSRNRAHFVSLSISLSLLFLFLASFHSLVLAFNGPNDVNDIFDTLAEGSY